MKENFKNINILVIGDSCIDIFRYGYTLRLAPEGPAPVFNPIRDVSNGGMASNVKANITAIGAKATLITQKEENNDTPKYMNCNGAFLILSFTITYYKFITLLHF